MLSITARIRDRRRASRQPKSMKAKPRDESGCFEVDNSLLMSGPAPLEGRLRSCLSQTPRDLGAIRWRAKRSPSHDLLQLLAKTLPID
jgi:hypothetical protein